MFGYDDQRKIIAFDSIPVKRSHDVVPGVHRSFMGHLAVGISVSDVADLSGKYEALLDGLFEELGLEKSRRSYKASEVATVVGGRLSLGRAFFFRFGHRILALEGLKVNVIAGVFDEEELRRDVIAQAGSTPIPPEAANKVVPIYGGNPGRVYITLFDFLNRLSDGFSIAAAWRLTETTGLAGHTFLLDGFQGEVPRAWHELTKRNFVQLVPRGDHCNPYLSCSDLLLRSIDRQRAEENLPLDAPSLWRVLHRLGGAERKAELHVHMIGNAEIPMIAPYDRSRVQIDQYLRHPVFLVIKEKEGSMVEVENSPHLGKVYDRAYGCSGSVALYDVDASAPLVRVTDWIVIYGERGESVRKNLRSLGYTFNVWDLREEANSD